MKTYSTRRATHTRANNESAQIICENLCSQLNRAQARFAGFALNASEDDLTVLPAVKYLLFKDLIHWTESALEIFEQERLPKRTKELLFELRLQVNKICDCVFERGAQDCESWRYAE